jgi:transcriptional regulator with XRE-family HTH domain
MDDAFGPRLASHLAANLRQLRDVQGLTQRTLAQRAGVPRATLAHLETGGGNPTLQVVVRLATALSVKVDELIGPPRAVGRHIPAEQIRERLRAGVRVRELVPDPLPDLQVERIAIPPGRAMRGMPHTAGTREYLYCERGTLQLSASGQTWTLSPGDVVIFRGDQKHGYRNQGDDEAVGISIIVLPPPGA